MKPILHAALAALFFAATLLPCPAEEPPFTIKTDLSAAPQCEAFAEKAKKIAEEWYPKINDILFGKERGLPAKEVTIEFKPMDGVAHASGHKITISAEWVTVKQPDDYGMVVHELTHVVQNYRRRGNPGWLTEGIADYVRDRHYEPGKRSFRPNPVRSHYKQGYGITGAFLAWLEAEKDKDIVGKLNRACYEGKYKDELFEEYAGKPLDDLWREYVEATRRDRPQPQEKTEAPAEAPKAEAEKTESAPGEAPAPQ